MSSFSATCAHYFDVFFREKTIRKVEVWILRAAVLAFLLHLLLIFLGNHWSVFQNVQHSYLKAIYTPFSFILLYEVFLLVIIIPNSISEFIGKQFEVITLITLRSFFHDIADFSYTSPVLLNDPRYMSLLYDLLAALAMLGLTILYYRLYQHNRKAEGGTELKDFINIKKMVSLGMIFTLLGLSISSFYVWGSDMLQALTTHQNYPDPNTVFYADFFTVMIFVDVLLLLISFLYHFSFFTIFRNASFIITTILIRMSLTLDKPVNYVIILAGILFSICSFYLYSKRTTQTT